jgi:hypothetical protein
MIGECSSCRSDGVELVELEWTEFPSFGGQGYARAQSLCKLCKAAWLGGDRAFSDSNSDNIMRTINRAANEILKCVRTPTQTVSLDEFQTMFTPRRGPVFTICYDPFVDEDDSPGRVNIEGAD